MLCRGVGGLDTVGENQMIRFSSQPRRQGLPGAKSRGSGVGEGNAAGSGSQGQPEDPRIGARRQEGEGQLSLNFVLSWDPALS